MQCNVIINLINCSILQQMNSVKERSNLKPPNQYVIHLIQFLTKRNLAMQDAAPHHMNFSMRYDVLKVSYDLI